MKLNKMEDQEPLINSTILAYNVSVGWFVGEYEGNHTFYVLMTDSDPVWIHSCTHWIPLPPPPADYERKNDADI